MLVQQSVYTSIKSQRHHGYQLAASSVGISNDEARELSKWGPAHDSLGDSECRFGSSNFHRLKTGSFCVSKSIPICGEYSKRGGPRVFTHQFVIREDGLKRFAGDAFRILDALTAAGHRRVDDQLSHPLPTIRLIGGATVCNHQAVQRMVDLIGVDRSLQLVAMALTNTHLGIMSDLRGDYLLSGLINLMPPQMRPLFSFCTALRCSSRRPFRLQMLPANLQQARQEARRSRLTIHDLSANQSIPLEGEWLELLKSAIDRPAVDLPVIQKLANECPSADPDDIAEFVTARV